jgi:hypothetical protein
VHHRFILVEIKILARAQQNPTTKRFILVFVAKASTEYSLSVKHKSYFGKRAFSCQKGMKIVLLKII